MRYLFVSALALLSGCGGTPAPTMTSLYAAETGFDPLGHSAYYHFDPEVEQALAFYDLYGVEVNQVLYVDSATGYALRWTAVPNLVYYVQGQDPYADQFGWTVFDSWLEVLFAQVGQDPRARLYQAPNGLWYIVNEVHVRLQPREWWQ